MDYGCFSSSPCKVLLSMCSVWLVMQCTESCVCRFVFSWNSWAFRKRCVFRRISRARRTRNWLQTFYSLKNTTTKECEEQKSYTKWNTSFPCTIGWIIEIFRQETVLEYFLFNQDLLKYFRLHQSKCSTWKFELSSWNLIVLWRRSLNPGYLFNMAIFGVD